MGVFGAPVEFAWVATRMRRPHRHNARRHDGRQSEPRASGITLPVTSLPHNERSYHIGTTRADTTERAQRAFRMRDSPHHIEKRSANHVATDAERPALQLPPRRGAKAVKMHTISRAEGGQLQARVRPQPMFRRTACCNRVSFHVAVLPFQVVYSYTVSSVTMTGCISAS